MGTIRAPEIFKSDVSAGVPNGMFKVVAQDLTFKSPRLRSGYREGPLIKSDKGPFITKLAIATVSPKSGAISRY